MNPKKTGSSSSNGSTHRDYFDYSGSSSNGAGYGSYFRPPQQRSQRSADPFDDDEERKSLSKSLGDASSKFLRFFFSPGLVIFVILLFIGFCFFVNANSYHDLLNSGLDNAVNRLGRTPLPKTAPPDQRLQQFLLNVPILGDGFKLLYRMFGDLFTTILAAIVGFLVQATELMARIHWYFEKAGYNILYKLSNIRRPAYQQNSAISRKTYRELSSSEQVVLRILFVCGVAAYVFDIWSADQTRPWFDSLGNPIARSWVWNLLSVAGIEIALLIHRGYRMIEPMWNDNNED